MQSRGISKCKSTSWLAMQDAYNLWQAKKTVKLGNIQKIKLNAA
jgi:plasmid maintenance system antidote protein VapI